MVALVFWTIVGLGPIPFWHLLLHLALPFWKRRPRAFYGACAVLWGLFVPPAFALASQSSPLFEPSGVMKGICLGASLAALGVTIWSIATLTPGRFFLYAALRPEHHPPVLIRRGPYRLLAHPTYLSVMVAAAASFLASGEAVLFGAFWAMVVLLVLVIVLEQRELHARLRATSSGEDGKRTTSGSPPAIAVPAEAAAPSWPPEGIHGATR